MMLKTFYLTTFFYACLMFRYHSRNKLPDSAPSRTSGLTTRVNWLSATNQGPAILAFPGCTSHPRKQLGEQFGKVSEQLVQQQSLSVPVAPLFLNEWGCLITGAGTGPPASFTKDSNTQVWCQRANQSQTGWLEKNVVYKQRILWVKTIKQECYVIMQELECHKYIFIF